MVDCSSTVESVKDKIYDMKGIPPHQQRLIFDGMILRDEYTLNDYDVMYTPKCIFQLHVLDEETSVSFHQLLKFILKENNKQLLNQNKLLEDRILSYQRKVNAQQKALKELQMLSTDLKLELHINKEEIKKLRKSKLWDVSHDKVCIYY